MVSQLRAIARAEGGAIRLVFILSDPTARVRVVRAPQGQAADSAQALELFSGQPEHVPRHPYVPGHSGQAAQLWDLERGKERFEDSAHAVAGQSFSYYVFENGESAPAQVDASDTGAMQSRWTLDIKSLAYQRLRYHTRIISDAKTRVRAEKQETLLTLEPPVALIKTRSTLESVHMGEYQDGSDIVRLLTFRAVAELLLIAETPDERDRLGDLLGARLPADLSLYEALGWQGLGMTSVDGIWQHQDAPLYRREWTLDGLVDLEVRRPASVTVGDILVEC